MENYFNLMISSDDVMTLQIKNLIFKDGIEPDFFLPRIKLKTPSSLTDPELLFIWNEDGQCIRELYFDKFLEQFKVKYLTYLTYLDLIGKIRNFQVDYVKSKIPSDLNADDLEILWIKYSKCKADTFKNVNINTYTGSTGMTGVLNKILTCSYTGPNGT